MIFRIVRSLANNTLSLPSLLFNPFVPNAPILYPLKTSENLTVLWCFQGVEKECIWNEWVKEIVYWRLPHLSLHWLIMRVLCWLNWNLNPLWTDLIYSKFWLSRQLHFFRDVQFFIGFFIFIFIILICKYLSRLFRIFRNNLFNRQWSRLVGSK